MRGVIQTAGITAACLGLAATAQAAAISAGSTYTELGSTTSSTGITPYATDGYYLFAAGTSGADINRDPSYITAPAVHDSEVHDSGYGYAKVATPQDGTVTTGTVTNGTNTDKFSFTLGSTVPSSIIIGILVDNLNGTFYNAGSLTVSDTSMTPATTLTQTEAAGDNNPDLYTFVLQNANPGDVIQIGAGNGSGGYATLSGVTFSTPEPASLALLALAGAGLLARRRQTGGC